jgi:TP901 family phage tail tape measure protein
MADIYTRILLSCQSGSTLKTIQSVSSALGKSGLAGDLEKVAQSAKTTGIDVSKLDTLQAKAGESAARLSLAEARAAESLKRANDLAASGSASAEKIARANAQAALAAEKVKVAERGASEAMQKAASEANRLSDEMESVSAKTSKAGNAFGPLISKAKELAAAGFGIAMKKAGDAIAETIPMAQDFQEAMLQTYGATDLTREQIDAIGNSILSMGPKVRKGPQDLAEAYYYVSGAGYEGAQAMDILERSAKSASAGLTETTVPANAVTAILKAFPGISVAQAFDMLTVSVNTGKTELKDFAPAIGEVSLHAKRAGVDFDEATAALSSLTNVMPSTAEAATSLSSLFQTSSRFEELTNRANDLGYAFDTNAYKNMNFIDRLRYLQQVTGGNEEAIAKLLGQEEALPAMTALLTDGSKDYANALDKVTNSAGAADEQFKKTGEGGKASWASVQSRIESLQIKIGTGLLPVVDRLVSIFDKMITVGTNVVKFFRDNEVAMVALQAVLIAIAVVILIIVVPAFIAWAAAMIPVVVSALILAAPFILIGVIIAVVVFGIIMAIRHWGEIVKWLQDRWSDVSAFFSGIWAKIQEFFGNVGKWFQDRFEEGKKGVEAAFGAIGGWFGDRWKDIQNVFSNVGGWFQDRFKDASNGVQSGFGNTSNWFQDRGKDVQNAWDSTAKKVGDGAIWLYDHNYYVKAFVDEAIKIFEIGKKWISDKWNELVGIAASTWTNVSNAVRDNFNKSVQFVSDVWTNISLFFVNAWANWIVGPLTGLWTNVSNFFAFAWQNWIVNPLTSFWTSISNFFSNAWANWVVGPLTGLWTSVSAFFSNAWANWIVGPLTSMWNNVRNFFSNAWNNYVSTPISNLWNSISSTISGWASKAVQWGKNLIQSFIDGINAKAGEIGGALADTAGKIAQFLGFHSPTKEGPGRESDQWAPNFIEMYAKGLEKGLPRIQAATSKLATPISIMSLPEDVDRMMTMTLPPVETRASGAQSAYTSPTSESRSTTIVYAPVFNISTMARSREEVRRLAAMINDEMSSEFRMESSGYASGGIY